MPQLTDTIVRNGIYIDFEGKQDEPPILLGTLIDGRYQCVFFNNTPPWEEASGQYDGMYKQYLRVLDIEDHLNRLLKKAKEENRRFFAFSDLEYETIKNYIELDKELYININKKCYLKSWRRKSHPEELKKLQARRERARKRGVYRASTIGNQLIDYYKLAGGKIPTSYGKGQVTKKIGTVENSFERYSEFRNSSMKNFGAIVSHNKFDCEATCTLAKMCQQKVRTMEGLYHRA
jgi:hypothetical protein